MSEKLVFLLVAAALAPLSQSVTLTHEVNLGDTAVLSCPSNDDNHRFQFWHLQREDSMIGPTNQYNRNKYKYEVLTGTLTIRGVSSNEHGLYTCVCKHLTDNSFYSETVELIVKKDWEEVYETDPIFWPTKSLLTKLGLLTTLMRQTTGPCLSWTAMAWTRSYLGPRLLPRPPSSLTFDSATPAFSNLTFTSVH